MDHSQQFKSTLQIIRTVCNILGFNFLKRRFRWNERTAFCIFTAVFCVLCMPYTIYYCRMPFVRCLKFLSTAPEVLQAALKMYSVLRHHRLLASMFRFLEEVYTLNANAGRKRVQAQVKCAKIMSLCVRIGAASTICIYTVALLPPVYAYFVLKRKELFFDVLLPAYAPNTNIRYIVTLCVQFVAFSVGFPLNIIVDFIVLVLIIHFSLLTDLFLNAIKALGKDYNESRKNATNLRTSLKNCVLMHQDLINYISALNTFVSPIFFCQISTASLSLAVNCFCIVKSDWVGAYAFGLYAFLKIFMICILGTLIELMSDRMMAGLYDCPWHNLPVDCQKTISFLLFRSQKIMKFTISGFAPLNVATGASIMKAIYSYLMILLSLDA